MATLLQIFSQCASEKVLIINRSTIEQVIKIRKNGDVVYKNYTAYPTSSNVCFCTPWKTEQTIDCDRNITNYNY